MYAGETESRRVHRRQHRDWPVRRRAGPLRRRLRLAGPTCRVTAKGALTGLQEKNATTAPSSIDPTRFLHEQLAQASPDLLRQMLTTFINTLMSAEADAVCGAEYGPARPSGPITATATGRGSSTPAPAPCRWPFRSCG